MTIRLVLVMALGLTACAELKSVVRSVDDTAKNLCELFYRKHADELSSVAQDAGLSSASPEELAGEVCKVRSVLEPFIEHVTAVEQSGLPGTH